MADKEGTVNKYSWLVITILALVVISWSLLFGISGIAILLLSWMGPASLSERIVTTAIGSVGLIWAFSRALPLISILRGVNHKKDQ